MTKRLKVGVIIAVAVVLLIAAYLNRAYAHIFDTIGSVNLTAPERAKTYELGSMASSEYYVTDEPTLIAFVGDDLAAGVGTTKFTEALPYKVAETFADDMSIILTVHATPGIKAADAARELAPAAVADEAETVLLLVGTNDVYGLTSLADFRRDYGALLDALQGETTRHVYAMTIPLLGSSHLLYPPYGRYFRWRIDRLMPSSGNWRQAVATLRLLSWTR